MPDPRPPEPPMRERIVEAAARLFSERGYAGTSVREIAAALGVSNPSLYHHFNSKADLLAAVLAEPLARVEAAVAEAEGLSGEARTRRLVGGLLDALAVGGGVAGAALRGAGGLPEGHREVAEAARPHVAALLAEGLTGPDPDLRVAMAMGAVEAAVHTFAAGSPSGPAFADALGARRAAVTDLALRLLR